MGPLFLHGYVIGNKLVQGYKWKDFKKLLTRMFHEDHWLNVHMTPNEILKIVLVWFIRGNRPNSLFQLHQTRAKIIINNKYEEE